MAAKWQRERLYGLPVEEERDLLRWAFLDAVSLAKPQLVEALTAIGNRVAPLIAAGVLTHLEDENRNPPGTAAEDWAADQAVFIGLIRAAIPSEIERLLDANNLNSAWVVGQTFAGVSDFVVSQVYYPSPSAKLRPFRWPPSPLVIGTGNWAFEENGPTSYTHHAPDLRGPSSWNPAREPLAAFEARVEGHVQDVKAWVSQRQLNPSVFNHGFEYELEPLESNADLAREYWRPPLDGIRRRQWKPTPEFARHLNWLVERVLNGKSPARIAKEQVDGGFDAATHIRKATTALAKFIDVTPGHPGGAKKASSPRGANE